MNAEVLAHVAYQIANAQMRLWPFPHIYVSNVFPDDFYSKLIASLPPTQDYKGVQGKYKGRTFAETAAVECLDVCRTGTFADICRFPFKKYIEKRCGPDFTGFTELRLVLDSENYSIGPHTDAPWKVLSYLFYLPNDTTPPSLGTSLFLPRQEDFRCPGGPHHPFEPFVKTYTAPFLPNSCFAFFKTDFSFHGVEPITIPCRRDVLLWNLYDRK